MLTIEEANIRAKLTNIQASLTHHMEIIHKELGFEETFLKKDPNLSTLDGLVHLAVELAIQIKSMDVACDNWDATLKTIILTQGELQNFEVYRLLQNFEVYRLLQNFAILKFCI